MQQGDKIFLTHRVTHTTRHGIFTRTEDIGDKKAIYYLTTTKKRGWIELTSWMNESFYIDVLDNELDDDEAKVFADYINNPFKYSMHNPRYREKPQYD